MFKYSKFEELCKAHALKPSDIEKATGVSAKTLSTWKHGVSIPKADKVVKIAKFFNVPLELFLD